MAKYITLVVPDSYDAVEHENVLSVIGEVIETRPVTTMDPLDVVELYRGLFKAISVVLPRNPAMLKRAGDTGWQDVLKNCRVAEMALRDIDQENSNSLQILNTDRHSADELQAVTGQNAAPTSSKELFEFAFRNGKPDIEGRSIEIPFVPSLVDE